MTKTKVYFWLKIDKKFFDNIFIKRLKNIAGGYMMQIVYIRLMLESLEDDCILYYEGYFENLVEELATKLDVSVDDVNMTMAYFAKCGLVQIDGNGNAELPQAKAMIESETNWAKYKRGKRKITSNSLKLDNVQRVSNSCPTEIELEIELEKDIELQLEQKKAAAEAGKNPVFEKLKEAFGEMAISGTIVHEVEDLLKDHGQTLVLYALDETILNSGRSIRYTRSILERWKGQGLNTIEQVKQTQTAYKTKQKPNLQKQSGSNNFPEVPF